MQEYARSTCSSCCFACRAEAPAIVDESDPFRLGNLLKAGVITVQLGKEAQPDVYCEHAHSSDGWHPYGGTSTFLPLTNLADVEVCQELDFLVKHKFVHATYRVRDDGKLAIRIYLIPYDLVGAKGSLRVRRENVLGPARRYLRNLLPRVVKNWEGSEDVDGSDLIPTTKDHRTLAEIYSELASPAAIPVPGCGNISERLLNYNDNLDGLGLRSQLYRYQRRSVAAMIQKELDQQNVPDPLYIPLTTADGKPFFFQPGTLEVLLERPMVAPCRGGILCEELGTGKTVMVISLILATLRQLPKPEESFIDHRPVMTPLSFRHFPSSDYATARRRLSCKSAESNRVPSLVEILLHRSRVAQDENVPNLTSPAGEQRDTALSQLEDNLESLPLAELRKANTPFYYHYVEELIKTERHKRHRKDPGPKKMYLSAATLVVVPANLLSQWDREITKHSEYPLRVLILRAKTDMPSVRSLATDYDIILMTYTRFTAEASRRELSKLHSWKSCGCPEIRGTRIPDCTCEVPDVSPFLQIRWKRLVIDEGHVSASLSTILTPFTKILSFERRWIVTGTPTTNLLGLSLGKRTISEKPSHAEVDGYSDDDQEMPSQQNESHDTFIGASSSIGSTVNGFLTTSADSSLSASAQEVEYSTSTSSSRESSCPMVDLSRPRVWNKYDREDLRKLGNMITHFIAVPQFMADSKLINTHVTEPLLDPNGPRPGAIQVLNQVMETVMIRHRIEDVEDDVILPPLNHQSVMLGLDPLAIKSYNALQASIAINAVDSERTGQDYMFHPANADHLQVTVKNMSQVMFWSVDDRLYNVDQLHMDAQNSINTAIQRNRPQEDMVLIREAFKHIAIAANDPLWRSVQEHEDIPYRVYSMPQKIYDTWRRTPGSYDPSNPSYVGFLHADRLLKLYDMILQRPLISEDAMVEWGQSVVKKDYELRKAYVDSLKKTSSKSQHRNNRSQYEPAQAGHSQLVDAAIKKASAKETLKEMQTEIDNSIARLENAEQDVENNNVPSPPTSIAARAETRGKISRVAAGSCLAKVRIGPSASNKLNYIISEVLKYSPTEKFLIFSDSELTLAHIAEALELVHVKCLRFTAQIQPRYREQFVLTFETSETYRVFLMELKHGARGLNLVSASRVIFCEPVWQADVESQAIKRVHRIGQTRPITVKTLAIKGTAEENIVVRRHALHNSHDKVPKLIDEAGMRHFIENPKFIEPTSSLGDSIEFPLIDVESVDFTDSIRIKIKRPTFGSPSPLKRVRVEGPVLANTQVDPSESEGDRFKKRLRTIRFA